MNKEQMPYHPLSVHCVSKEESNCPLIPILIEICHIAKQKLNDENCLFLPSVIFGKRVIIPSSFIEVEKTQREEFVELIDYNPISNTLLYLGPNTPSTDVAVHWIVHHAKKEIQLIIQIKNLFYKNKMKQKITQLSVNENKNALEKAKKWLKTLQKNDVFLSDDHLIITASSSKSIRQNIKRLGKELEKI